MDKCATRSHVDIAANLEKFTENLCRRTEKFIKQELNDKKKEKWDEISLVEILKSIFSWKKKLRLVDSEDRGHMNHLVK